VNFRKYFEIGNGSVPIVLSCAHGGYKKPKIIPNKQKGIVIPDRNTYFVAKAIIQRLKAKNIKIYYVLSKIHRSKIDFNRPPRAVVAFNHSSKLANNIHDAYHDKLKKFTQKCVSLYNRCLFIDFHGFTKPNNEYPDIIFGNLFGNALQINNNFKEKNSNDYWGLNHLSREFSKYFTLDTGLGFTDFNLAYSGGYIIHHFYRRNKINATQLEVAKYIRLNNELSKRFINAFVSAIINCLKE